MAAALARERKRRRKADRGSVSPLEEDAICLLALIAEQPDLTPEEIVEVMHKRRIAGSRTAVWRFLKRHAISFKKSLRAAEQEREDVARARRRWDQATALSGHDRAGLPR
jgi:transposase